MDYIKEDMSECCDFKYNEYWLAANHLRTMPQDEWNKWFDEHCGKCKYMREICMYREECTISRLIGGAIL